MSNNKNQDISGFMNRSSNPFLNNTPDPSPQKPDLLRSSTTASVNDIHASANKRGSSDSYGSPQRTYESPVKANTSPLKSFQQQEFTNALLKSPLKKKKPDLSLSSSNSPYGDRFIPKRTEMDLHSVKYVSSFNSGDNLRFENFSSRNNNNSRSFPDVTENDNSGNAQIDLQKQKSKQADQLFDIILKNELFGDKLKDKSGHSSMKSQESLDIITLAPSSNGNSLSSSRSNRSSPLRNTSDFVLDGSLELSPTRSLDRGRGRNMHMSTSVSMPNVDLQRNSIFDDTRGGGARGGAHELHAERVRRRLNFADFEDSDDEEEDHDGSSTSSHNNNNNNNGGGGQGSSTLPHFEDFQYLKKTEKPKFNVAKGASLFDYSSSEASNLPQKSAMSSINSLQNLMDYKSARWNNKVTSVRPDSEKLLLTPSKKIRNIPKAPYRVLDAPGLSNDFYHNLIDWSNKDVLGVVLKQSCFLNNNRTNEVSELCSIEEDEDNDLRYTSIQWADRGQHVALGLSNGLVQVYDVTKKKCIRTFKGHADRVSCLSWNSNVLSSGSRDSTILHRDLRAPDEFFETLRPHTLEVCGLKWNTVDNKLASGGNDNVVCVFDGTNKQPFMQMSEHTAAVKAMAWSPHKRGLLATGGGTADRHMKVWNVNTSLKVKDIDTGSQVCNMVWSKNTNEILTSHGFSKFELTLWDYSTMTKMSTLSGHSFRVLHLALSPDGTTVVSGSGDETLRYWKLFDSNKKNERHARIRQQVQGSSSTREKTSVLMDRLSSSGSVSDGESDFQGADESKHDKNFELGSKLLGNSHTIR